MAIQNTDYFLKVGNPGTATTLSAPGYIAGGTTINVASTANFPADTAVIFGIDTVSLSSGTQVRNTGSYCVFVGIVTSATSIGSVQLLYGTPQNYAAAATTRVYITVSSQHINRLISGILQHANQDGSLKTTAVQNALGLGTSSLNGWNVLGATPSSVTANGNRSYNLVFNGSDQTGTLSPGMRLRTTRTVPAPINCASLNGSTQYFNRATTINGMTFTNNFVVSAWVKLSSYPSGTAGILSRMDAGVANGWRLEITSSGQVRMVGYNAGNTNNSLVISYQSVPLNKWVHIASQLDMATFTATPTTSYIMIDGTDIPVSVSRSGTNPTSLVQAGNLEVGSYAGGTNLFPGKISQVAIYGAKVTQATINASKDQSLAGTETNLISAYSFNNSLNDLNTTNANNLTANGGALATNADSPFGGQADGTISSTLDYGIVQKATFSTNTTVVVHVAEGCTIPTTGGVSAVAYSPNKEPYGFPGQRSKWQLVMLSKTSNATTSPPTSGNYVYFNHSLNLPIGEWNLDHSLDAFVTSSSAGSNDIRAGLSVSTTTPTSEELTYFTRNRTSGTTETAGHQSKRRAVSISASTAFYFLLVYSTSTATATAGSDNSTYGGYITAENSYL